MEPFLNIENSRTSLFPIQYQDIWDYYKKHQSLFWTATEVDLSKDIDDWRNKLTDDERHYIKHVLAFFASSDFIVNENEGKKAEQVVIKEYQFMINDKKAREDVHSESYALMIEAYITDSEEKTYLLNAVNTVPSVKKKADWFKKYINDGSFAEQEVSGAITEGIFFSGSFCAIFWLKKRGLMRGLSDFNELISRDEGLHRDVNCLIYKKYIQNKLSIDNIHNMIKEAVDIEIEFCSNSLPVSLIGMNIELMSIYIKYVADHLCAELEIPKIYSVKNPFEWMTLISLQTKVDFFASRSTNYSRQKNLTDKEENKIKIDDDY